jgi:hypothetical protein
MKKLLILGLMLSQHVLAEGYYYPVPANPPAYIYALPPAYIVPPQQSYIPPPVYILPIQRGYYPPPPDGWANSKIVPLPPKVDLYPKD